MAQKTTDITQQLDAIAEQIKLEGFMFKDNFDSDDDDDDEDIEQDPNVFLKDMNCCFILYLGSMTSKKDLDNPRLNCLYNQIKKQNHLVTSQNKIMDLVYILFIGPNADKKNRNEIRGKIMNLTNDTCNIFIDYIHCSFPTTSSKPVEQLFLLKHLFFKNTKLAQFKNVNSNEIFTLNKNIETDTEFKFLNSEKDIIFLKPTIPIVESEFFTLLSKMIEYYINENDMSKVIIVNGFWFETNSTLQDESESYLINNMEKSFITNILLGMIPYFIPFISEMKQRYNDKFVMVNQYFDQIPDLWCLDVIPRILSANAEVTLNGDQFLLSNNVSETKSGGKRKTRKKSKRKIN